MRLISLVSGAVILSLAGPAVAQDWVEFASTQDRFTINFLGQPKIEASIYTSEYGAELPARVYNAESGQARYSVTVVDYNQVERILTEKAKGCPPGAEPCIGNVTTGLGYWKNDLRGAMVHAAWQLMQRDVTVTHYVWNTVDRVEAHQLQLTSNTDQSRTFAAIAMHENKLYVVEATAPQGVRGLEQFQQSLGWLDENGIGLRYQDLYRNGIPAPPPVDRNTQPGQGRIDAPQ